MMLTNHWRFGSQEYLLFRLAAELLKINTVFRMHIQIRYLRM